MNKCDLDLTGNGSEGFTDGIADPDSLGDQALELMENGRIAIRLISL